MAIYALAQRTSGNSSGSAAWQIIAPAGNKPRIMELGLTLAAATASTYGLGRPASAGTPSATTAFLDESDGNGATGTTTGAVAWSGAPTAPTQFFRRVALPATIGEGVIWTFPRGLGLPVNGTVVLWNLAANGVVDAYAVVDE